MARTRYIPDVRSVRQIMQSAEVRDGLKARAEAIAPVARRLAAEEVDDNFAEEIRVESGTRPKGRPYARVTAARSDAEANEWGDTNTIRRRILGRAAGTDIYTGGD
ncbi:hypothetical protein [Streptomyces tremellae]|uniref:HK97 gp10 family phage protein n=1 Tax=Streptomyces tremellae TaxID=1124239 RepID=A0ABP7EXN1_9ACTN